MSARQIVLLGIAALLGGGIAWGLLGYADWERDRREATVVARAVRYAVEQFSPAYLDYLRKQRKAPRDNMDLNLAPPRDPLWTGLTRAELYPNGDVHLEYEPPGGRRQPLLVWHIDARGNFRGGLRVCGARDIPARVLAWVGLECDGEVAVPAKDAPIPALRLLAIPDRPVSELDDVLDAVRRNDPVALEALRAAGRDVCAANPEKYTALGEAARGNQARVIPVLAAACGVDPIEPFSGRSALMLAVATRNVETVHALLAAGADPNLAMADGESAWFALGTEGSDPASPAIRSMLLARGANPDARAAGQSTLLMRAARTDNIELAAWLLDNGASIDLQDQEGRTAVMHAAAAQREMMLRLLVSRKANLALADAQGRTALALVLATETPRKRDLAQILRDGGAKH